MDKVKMFCSKDCPDACSFYASIEKDNNISITPDEWPFLKKGFVCKKLKNFYRREIMDNNARSFFIENGRKIEGEGVVENLSDFLLKNKDKKILFYMGSGSLGYSMGLWEKLFSYFDSCYFVKGFPCDETGIAAHKEDFGVCINPPIENLKNVDSIILFGKNAFVVSPHLFVYLRDLKNVGKKIIYIDPVKSQTVAIADEFMQINPAADGILAYLLLVSLGYIKNSKYDVEALIDVTGLEKSEIESIAKNIKSGKTAFMEGFGMQRYANGKNIIQWINRLAYYSGNTDNLYYSRSSREGLKKMDIHKKHAINIADTVRFLEKGFFDIIVVVAANPVVTMPESLIWESALKNSLSVVIDTNYTETTKYADFFIRVGGMYAQEDIQGSYFFNKTLTRNRLTGNIPSDRDVIKKLSKTLSINVDIPQVIEHVLAYEKLKAKRVFNNKNIEILTPYSEHGRVRLITLSHFDYLNSQTYMINKEKIYISQETAERLGIEDNSDVVVKNELGEYIFRCFVTDKVKGDNAYAYKNRSVFVNRMTKSMATDAVYAISYYDLFVDIIPIKRV